jgi:hypothetical protein
MTRWLVVIVLLGGCKKEPEPEKVELPPLPSATVDAAPRKPLDRPLTQTETSLAGTWVARVDGQASQTKALRDKMFVAPPGVSPGDCIWLELYDDLTGFRDECAVVSGEPSALESKNALTGQTQRLAFDWEAADAAHVKITYRDDVLLPGAAKPFRSWHLAFVRQDGDLIYFAESFPELGADVHREYGWEIISGRYLGDGK